MTRLAPSPPREAGIVQGIAISLTSILTKIATVLMVPILPAMTHHFAAMPHAETLVPMLLTIPSLCIALFATAIGFIADRIGQRRILLASLLVYGIAGTVPAYVDNFLPILLSRFAVGVADAGILVCSVALLSDYFEGEQRQKWVANEFAIATVGATILIVASGFLGAANWQLPFFVYGLGLAMWLLVKTVTWAPAAPIRAASLDEPRASIGAAHAIRVAVIALVGSFVYYIMPIEIGFVLGLHGVNSPRTIALITALGAIVAPLGALLSRRVVHLPPGRGLSLTMLLLGAGLMIIATAPNWHIVILGVVVQQFGGGMMMPLGLNYMLAGLPRASQGRTTGLWWSFYFGAQFLTPLIMAGITRLSGNLSASIFIAGLLAWLCCAPLLLLRSLARPVAAHHFVQA